MKLPNQPITFPVLNTLEDFVRYFHDNAYQHNFIVLLAETWMVLPQHFSIADMSGQTLITFEPRAGIAPAKQRLVGSTSLEDAFTSWNLQICIKTPIDLLQAASVSQLLVLTPECMQNGNDLPF